MPSVLCFHRLFIASVVSVLHNPHAAHYRTPTFYLLCVGGARPFIFSWGLDRSQKPVELRDAKDSSSQLLLLHNVRLLIIC